MGLVDQLVCAAALEAWSRGDKWLRMRDARQLTLNQWIALRVFLCEPK